MPKMIVRGRTIPNILIIKLCSGIFSKFSINTIWRDIRAILANHTPFQPFGVSLGLGRILILDDLDSGSRIRQTPLMRRLGPLLMLFLHCMRAAGFSLDVLFSRDLSTLRSLKSELVRAPLLTGL